MEKNKSLVEEAIIQMKNLEEVIAENAKGILASTMKGEISELVKESLNETKSKSEMEEEDEDEMDIEMMGMEDEESEDEESEDEESEEESEEEDSGEEEMDIEMMDIEAEPMDDTLDMTDFPMDEVMKVFIAAKPEDEIIVKKDSGYLRLKDDEKEYLISMNESEEEMDEMYSEEMDEMFGSKKHEFKRRGGHKMGDVDGHYKDYEMDEESEEEMDEVMYEIEMDDEMEMDIYDPNEEEIEFMKNEEYSISEGKKMSIKPKGVGMGHASKAKYPKTLKHGTTEAKKGITKKAEAKEGKMSVKPVGKGIGKGPKFTYEEGEHMKSTKGMKDVKFSKKETKEAARTLGNGKRWGKPGLPKPKAAPRHLNLESEVRSLREKNEEYRKALNIFREKLNEVAVFNANLAYATRLFTEHSTTKQEKINILRRFDSVDSLKESKALYKTLKEEFSSNGQGNIVKESIETKIDRNPASGSAVNLIENKTYENPQFLRMKDLMSKLIK